MRFETTESFKGDFARLSDRDKQLFRRQIPAFVTACEAFVVERQPFPKSLRVKPVQGAKGVWEMCWSFAGPDGRATFEWVQIGNEPGIRWRRIGGHEVFTAP